LNPEEYRIMYEAEESHWWYVGMRKVFLSILDRYYPPEKAAPPSLLVLDAGCGTGAMISRLGRYGRVYGFDLAEEAIFFCRRRGFDGSQLVRASIASIPFADGAFDLLLKRMKPSKTCIGWSALEGGYC